MVFYYDDFLMHHGRKGQQWGITNGPPYPLATNNKDYKKKQSLNNGIKKVKQFLYDRFSEYGKDHQAVRDKYIDQFKRKGYNETASQILAEQKYQEMDKALLAGSLTAIGVIGAAGIGGLSYGFLIRNGGIPALKTAIGKKIAESMTGIMSSMDMSSIASASMNIDPSSIASASMNIDPSMVADIVKNIK